MKKLFATLLLLVFAAPAFGASVTLSSGASCEYSSITIAAGGSASVTCADGPIVVPPVVVPPVVVPPVVTPTYVAAGLWIQAESRKATGTMSAGQEKAYPFTVPSGFAGVMEVGISGLNLKVFIDGVETAGDEMLIKPGPHTLTVRAVGSADGSIGLYHTP